MSVYFITGKLGGGKSLVAVSRIKTYLEQGRRVATNLNLDLEHMLGKNKKADAIRVPDKPCIEDLESLGRGNDDKKLNENRYGLLCLDELGTWLNSRSWSDKSRAPVLDWFLHARKLRWDVLLIVQDISIIDKQLREALCEFLVMCRRLDRMPFFQHFAPKIHIGSVYYGDSPNNSSSFKVVRWWYRGTGLYKAYDTEQVFSPRYDKGLYCYLPPYHTKGRYQKAVNYKEFTFNFIKNRFAPGAVGLALGVAATASNYPPKQPEIKDVKEAISETLQIENKKPFEDLEPIFIIGNLGKSLIFSTRKGDYISSELYSSGIGIKYINPCLAVLTQGNNNITVNCQLQARPAQQAEASTSTDGNL